MVPLVSVNITAQFYTRDNKAQEDLETKEESVIEFPQT